MSTRPKMVQMDHKMQQTGDTTPQIGRRRRFFSLCLLTIVVLTLLLILLVFVFYSAIQVKPAFYQTALEVEPESQITLSHTIVQRCQETVDRISTKDRDWELQLGQDEINAYLAVDLLKSYPKLLPSEIKNPRIAIQNDNLELACEVETSGISGVLHLTLRPRFINPNQCLLQIRAAHLGVVSLSRSKVCDLLGNRVRLADVQMERTTDQGGPALLITFKVDANPDLALLLKQAEIVGDSLKVFGSSE
ncbi:MAG: hypothetical protein ACRC10_04500 [Thermoguttaceae bacterium]